MTQMSPYLTPTEAATELGMTPDGVRKLVQRGKLKAVRLSERHIAIPRSVLAAYQRRLNGEAYPVPELPPVGKIEELAARFEMTTGLTAAAWLDRWKRDEIEDSAANMELMMQASSIRAAELSDEAEAATAVHTAEAVTF